MVSARPDRLPDCAVIGAPGGKRGVWAFFQRKFSISMMSDSLRST
jgi:hypothetical protein